MTSLQVLSLRPWSQQPHALNSTAALLPTLLALLPPLLPLLPPPPPPLSAEKCAAVTVSVFALTGPEIAAFSRGRNTETTSISWTVRGLNHPGLRGFNLSLRRPRAGIRFLRSCPPPPLSCVSLYLRSAAPQTAGRKIEGSVNSQGSRSSGSSSGSYEQS